MTLDAQVPETAKEHMNRRAVRGFTLIELMIVVAIVAVLAVLAIYGVRRYIANSKSTEAKNALGQISKDAAAAFEHESTTSTIVASGGTSTFVRALCDSSTMVPATVPAATKYQSQKSDWNSGSATAGWQCLKFTMEQPQYYSYQYVASNTSATSGAYQIDAYGDLNGDSVTSHFWVNGSVQGGQLTTSPTVQETNPEE
jgi:type IV pilus assembly protein PilA